MEKLTDIVSACRLLGASSRTLRYYEEIGLIESVRLTAGGLRHYTAAGLERLKKILFLRRLGLSLEDIRAVVDAGEKTNAVLKTKYAYLYSELDGIRRKMRLIEEVISVAEADGDIYSLDVDAPFEAQKARVSEIAGHCAELFLREKFEDIAAYFDDNLRVYLPVEALKKGWHDTTAVCGAFIRPGKTELKDNIVTQRLIYEKVNVSLRFVFNNFRLSGLWIEYCGEEQGIC